MLIDESRAREVLGPHPWLAGDGYRRLAAAASADPGEDATFLPYAKLALAVLIEGYAGLEVAFTAVLAAYLDLAAAADPGDDGRPVRDRRVRAAEAVARLSHDLAALHLRPLRIGPDRSPKTVAEVNAWICANWPPMASLASNRKGL